MNKCKVVQAKENCIKDNWYSSRGEKGRVRYAGAKKCLANSNELNTLVASSVAKSMKMIKKFKSNDTSNSENENN